MRKSLLILLFIPLTIFSTEFKFKFDESYRIESTVYQNVLLNKEIQLSSIILNKYIVNIIEDYGDSALLDVNHHVFQDSKGLTSGFYTSHESEKGIVKQNADGTMIPESDEYFPAVQNVPYFPDRDIKVGESWTSTAIEYFDLKNGFNIEDVISTTFRVFYTYIGNRTIEGRLVAMINMNYNIYQKIKPYIDWGDFYPIKISGGSKQTLYWDIEKGRPYSVDDEFFIDFYTSTNDKYTFKGTTESRSWPKNELKSDKMLALIDSLENTPQTSVIENEEYLKITFNSLLFAPESAYLRNDVKQYLDKIGSTLNSTGDINIRILGHTAIFGESKLDYLKQLSTKRAIAVAEYLLSKGYIDRNSIEIIGMGGTSPIESNITKEGRSLNRRVEIDILKN